MIQTKQLQCSQATPYASVQLDLSDASYHKLVGIRLVGSNDNASAAVAAQLVISRDSSPLATGNFTAEKALERGDPVILRQDMLPGGTCIVGRLVVEESILDDTELMDENTYLGVRALGLEAGKVADFDIEVETATVGKTTSTESTYLKQLLRFQQT